DHQDDRPCRGGSPRPRRARRGAPRPDTPGGRGDEPDRRGRAPPPPRRRRDPDLSRHSRRRPSRGGPQARDAADRGGPRPAHPPCRRHGGHHREGMHHVSTDDRPDPIEGIMEVTEAAESDIRDKARALGRTRVIGRACLVSAVLCVLLAASLAVPHSDGVRGFDVLFFTEVAQQQQTSLPSFVFVLLCSVGSILFGGIMVIAQKWWAAAIAWGSSCVAVVYGMLAIWLRQSGRGPNPDFEGFGGPGIGIYLSVILVLALALALAGVVWARVPEQRSVEESAREGH